MGVPYQWERRGSWQPGMLNTASFFWSSPPQPIGNEYFIDVCARPGSGTQLFCSHSLAGVYGYFTVQRRLGSQVPSHSSNVMEKGKIDKSPSSKCTTCKSMTSGCAQSFPSGLDVVPNGIAICELKGKFSLLLHSYSHLLYSGGRGSRKSQLKLPFKKEEKEMHTAAHGP